MTEPDRASGSPVRTTTRVLLGLLIVVVLVVVFAVRGGDSNAVTTTVPVLADTTPSVPAIPPTTGVEPPTPRSLSLTRVVTGLSEPTDLGAPVGDDRLFVVERAGTIRVVSPSGELLPEPFLDIEDRVLSAGVEQGLLGLAFHPGYTENGRFFVYYTGLNGNRVVAEFTVSSDEPDRGLESSEVVLLDLEHPVAEPRHHGGQIAFDPEGLLWIASGDGTDSRRQGQDPETPYGVLMRMNVDDLDENGTPEIWAYGLRNPWRFSFDTVDRLVYVADVGQNDREEINVVSLDEGGGYNFGWSDMEGDLCYAVDPCDPDDYTAPVLVYPHDPVGSVTGGFVYRGSEIPEIDGVYFYSDWMGGWVRSFRFEDGVVTDDHDWTEELGGSPGPVSSFGLDGHGEMYLVTWSGSVYKLTAERD